MVVVEGIEQSSRAWQELRLGVVTASEASKIVTATGRLSSQRTGYMAKLLVERITGEPIEEDFAGNDWVERGKLLEPKARAYYSFTTGLDVREVSFVFQDDERLVGCSPDGMVGDRGLLELKAPSGPVHMGYWLDSKRGVSSYFTQLQFQLFVTGLDFVDFLSWHPDLPPSLVRVSPDEKMQEAFGRHVTVFLGEMREALATLKEEGFAPEVEHG